MKKAEFIKAERILKKFLSFLFRNRLTFWLTTAALETVLLAALGLLFRIRMDWPLLLAISVGTPTCYLILVGRKWG